MGKKSVFWIQLKKINGEFKVRAVAKLDSGTSVKTNWYAIANAANLIEVDWRASSGPGNNDGYLKLVLNGGHKQQKVGLDNDTFVIKQIRLGFTNSPRNFTVSGIFFIDDYISSDLGHIGS